MVSGGNDDNYHNDDEADDNNDHETDGEQEEEQFTTIDHTDFVQDYTQNKTLPERYPSSTSPRTNHLVPHWHCPLTCAEFLDQPGPMASPGQPLPNALYVLIEPA